MFKIINWLIGCMGETRRAIICYVPRDDGKSLMIESSSMISLMSSMVSRMIRSLPSFSRPSLGSLSLNSMFGNLACNFGRSFRVESFSNSGVPED